MKAKPVIPLDEWVSAGFKGLAICIFSMFTFFVNQLNGSISALTSQLRSMEIHQVDTDKRVAAIEVSREINMESFKRVIADVEQMKSEITQSTMRLQTVADVVAKHLK